MSALGRDDELSAPISQGNIDDGFVVVMCNGEAYELFLPSNIRAGDTYHIRMPAPAFVSTGEGHDQDES